MKPAVHQYEDKLLEFAYGELPRPEAEAVEAHVRNCPRCTEALGQIREVRTTMGHLPLEAAPDAGLDSLLAYADQTARRNAQGARKDAWWRRLIMPLATVAALSVVGVVAWRANEEFQPDPVAMGLKLEREREEKNAEAMEAAKEKAQAPGQAAAPAPAAANEKERPFGEPAQVQAPATAAGDDLAAAFTTEKQRVSDAPDGVEDERAGKKAGLLRGVEAKAALPAAPPPPPEDLAKDFEYRAPPPAKPQAKTRAPSKMASEEQAYAFDDTGYRGSVSKREVDAKKKGAKPSPQPANKLEDWSNAAQRGGRTADRTVELNEGTSVTQALEGNAVGGSLSSRKGGEGGEGGPALGLSTGAGGFGSASSPKSGQSAYVPPAPTTASGPREAPQNRAAADVAPEGRARQDGEARKKDARPADGKTASQSPARFEAPPAAAAPARAPVATPTPRSSLGISLSGSSGSGRGSVAPTQEEDSAVAESEAVVDKLGTTRDAAFARRQRLQGVEEQLKRAREAGARGDHLAEVKLCLAALDDGAEAYQRVEALKRLCDGFEALGEFDRAQRYCDTLVKEFRSTAAARMVLERQKRQRAQKANDELRLESEPKPAEVKPAQDLPAAAH